MKKRNNTLARFCTWLTFFVLSAGVISHSAFAETYSATTMRLLKYEGTVEIEDASGNARAVIENARFDSGEAMKTGENSTASVGLDNGRVVTLDALSRVEFVKQANSLTMNLTEGRIFLDVAEKLNVNETMDIRTSTMVIGIRGTIVYISTEPVTDESAADLQSVDLEGLAPEKGRIVSISQIGVLEGTADITYLDDSNKEQSLSVEAGQKATVPEYSEDAVGIPKPVVSDITADEIEGFVLNQVTSDVTIFNRVKEACDVVDDIDLSGLSGIYTADGDWTWDSPVTLVAQSASKYYDGHPLTRTSDILVSGLPSIFSVKASAGGSRTDAGESDNPVAGYSIYNKAGEDITRHFTNVETVSGTLLVVPAPLTIHTGTAGKVYDGTPLTDPEAYITFYKGSGNREVPWRNTSYVVTESAGSVSYDNQTLYGICGVIWVNAANPLTGERREIQLKAGQKLTVFLSDLEGRQSIDLKIEDLTENDLPEELLRLYGDNPDLLQQACKDTGWDIELLKKLIEALPETPSNTATIEQGGLVIRETESDRLMQDLTNVRITIDTEITNYNNRALGSEEAHYTSLAVDESIKVTATGSQTDVGTSENTYTIDWGNANRNNYEVGEDLGTLTVTPASVTITTGSAEKEYDGSPLTNSEASISGLVNGETATVTATGSITDVGSTENSYTIDWGSADPDNYNVSAKPGTLKVTARRSAITLTAASAEKTYDGTALTDSSVTAEGLPDGFTFKASVSGRQTDVGSSENTISSYTIYDANGKNVTGQFSNVTTKSGTLTVKPLKITFDLGFSTEESGTIEEEGEGEQAGVSVIYDGTSYLPEWITGSYEGADEPLEPDEWNSGEETDAYSFTFTLPGNARLQLEGAGYSDAGSYTFEPESTFLEGKEDNFEITYENNTLEITPAELTIQTASDSKVYDGEPLTNDSVNINGLAAGDTISVTPKGTITNAGTVSNAYDIEWTGANPDNYSINETLGELRVNPVELVLIANCSWAAAGDIVISEYGIKVQVNNVDASQYQVYQKEENLWQIDWAWGDKNEVTTFLIKDDATWTITTLAPFIVGTGENYSIEKIDQEGTLDIPIIIEPDEGTDSNPSGGTAVNASSVIDGKPDMIVEVENGIDAGSEENEDLAEDENATPEEPASDNEAADAPVLDLVEQAPVEPAPIEDVPVIEEPEEEETQGEEETQKEETQKEESPKEKYESHEEETPTAPPAPEAIPESIDDSEESSLL